MCKRFVIILAALGFSFSSSAAEPAVDTAAVADAAITTAKIADGAVKPNHAATPPRILPLNIPRANPTWLDIGPGKNWHNATRS